MIKMYFRYAVLAGCLTAFFLFLFLLNACREKEEFVPLKVMGIEPGEALLGDTILIRGEGFSPGYQFNRVFFPGISQHVQPHENSTEHGLWVQVPEGAASGMITVNLFDTEVGNSPEELLIKLPVVESITPGEGSQGDTVTIKGYNFRPRAKENNVYFASGTARLKATVIGGSAEELAVIIPDGALTGLINIMGVPGPEFKITPPVITTVSPLEAGVGDTLTINGRGLSISATATVFFKGLVSNALLAGGTSRSVRVIVPEGAEDGPVKLTYAVNGKTIEIAGQQNVLIFPSITSIAPRNGKPGNPVTITGFNFSADKTLNEVQFNGVTAQVTNATRRELKVIVPPGTTTGAVTLELLTNNRKTTGPVFEISADGTPIILSINPTTGPVGSFIVIEGDYFSTLPGGNTVQFNGITGSVVEASATQLKVKVPVGATTGPVTVTKEGKTGTGPDFTIGVGALPAVSFFSPAEVSRGQNFTIHGANFATIKENIRAEILGNTEVVVLPVVSTSESEVVVTMPANAMPGEYRVYVSSYNQNSNQDKTITIVGQPQITSLSVTEGAAGTELTITGNEFHNIETENAVQFGSATADFVDPNDILTGSVKVAVPDIAPGTYDVTVSAFGVTSNVMSFTVKEKILNLRNVYYTLTGVFLQDGSQGIRLEKASAGQATRTTIFEQPGTGSQLRALAIDLSASVNKVYFSFSTSNVIARSNLDNTGYQELYRMPAGTANAINDISLDASHGHLYWSIGNSIYRGDILGADSTLLYTNPSATAVTGFTYSSADNRIYLCERTSSILNIVRINADGSGRIELFTAVNPFPYDVKVDVSNGKIALLCGTTATSAASTRRIFTGNLDGSGSLTDFHSVTTKISGIALDPGDQYVYWIMATSTAGAAGNGIYRKRYDGADIPGTNPPVAVQQVYTIPNQANTVYTGLAVEETTGAGSSQRIRVSLTMEYRSFEE